MASRAVIMSRSAFTTRDIINNIMAEGDRRLRCCSPELSWHTKAGFLTDLNIQLMNCGHSQDFRDMVPNKMVARYQDSLARHWGGERPLYQSREEREDAWARVGAKENKATWFRKTGAGTVLTVPSTQGGRLAKVVKEALRSAPGYKTLFREQPGPSVRQSLARSNFKPTMTCDRPLCPWTRREEDCNKQCYREGVMYLARSGAVTCQQAIKS